MRSSARRSVAASTWLRAEMPTMWSQRQTPSSSIAASETFGYQPGPTYGNRFRQDCLASQQPSTKPRSGSTPSTGSTPSAGHRMGRGKGALASPLRLQRTTSTPTYRASFLHVCASKTRGRRGAEEDVASLAAALMAQRPPARARENALLQAERLYYRLRIEYLEEDLPPKLRAMGFSAGCWSAATIAVSKI